MFSDSPRTTDPPGHLIETYPAVYFDIVDHKDFADHDCKQLNIRFSPSNDQSMTDFMGLEISKTSGSALSIKFSIFYSESHDYFQTNNCISETSIMIIFKIY